MNGTEKKLLRMEDVNKSFAGVSVLKDVNFTLHEGEVHALLGENGAGKSTLMKILCGSHSHDGGNIYINEEVVTIKSPRDAIQKGVSIINQELSPMMELTVAENIFMGRQPKTIFGFIDRGKMNEDAAVILNHIGAEIKPSRRMSTLKISEIQLVEICKAISYDSKIIIMDEPTSTLEDNEVESLFRIVNELKSQGKSIIYISHKLDEIFRICDRVTILRDGEKISTSFVNEITPDEMIEHMVGRKIEDVFPSRDTVVGDVVLDVKNLQISESTPPISFQLRRGEVLGFAGLMGSGRTEVAESLFGIRKVKSKSLHLNNNPVQIKNAIDAKRNGLGFVTDDRKETGLVMTMSVQDNITLPSLGKVTRRGFLSPAKEAAVTEKYVDILKIKVHSALSLVGNLSGGNQQKVVLAKWLCTEPSVLILDEPTRGIDVGAKTEIYGIINELTKLGQAILFISSEMQEIIGVCDRVLVFRENEIVGEISKENFSQEAIVRYATGAA